MTKDTGRFRPDDDDLPTPAGWDALADDLFGLNVRGLRSMVTVFASPRRYFDAARETNWLGRYTPSIRLIFLLTALMSFLRFVWGSDTSAMVTSLRASVESVKDLFPNRTVAELAEEVFSAWLIALPFVYFTLHALLSLVLRVWGKGTPTPVRIRLHFANLLPAMVLGLLTMPVYAFVSDEAVDIVSTIGFLMMAGLYFITYLRGMSERLALPQRLWRGALFSAAALTTDTLASLVSYLIAFIWVSLS